MYKPPGGLIFEGAIKPRVFCFTILSGLYLEGLIHGGAYFRNFTVSSKVVLCDHVHDSHDHSVLQSIDITRRNLMLITLRA